MAIKRNRGEREREREREGRKGEREEGRKGRWKLITETRLIGI